MDWRTCIHVALATHVHIAMATAMTHVHRVVHISIFVPQRRIVPSEFIRLGLITRGRINVARAEVNTRGNEMMGR